MTNWLQRLTPDDYVASVYDIPLHPLWAKGKRLLLCDLDNTLVPWNDPDVPTHLVAWLKQAQQLGFDVCIVSNNDGSRVAAFAQLTAVPFEGAARKPRPDALLRAMRRFGRNSAETVMVGDQLFTDIQAARRAGVHSILVMPISHREWWPTRLVRRAERMVLWRLTRAGHLTAAKRQKVE